MPKTDADLISRHPAFVRFFERAKLRSRAQKKRRRVFFR